MRRSAEWTWPDLGFRFDRPRAHRGHAACFTCEADDLLLGRAVTLRVISHDADEYERDLFEREADALTRIGAHRAVVSVLERSSTAAMEILVLQSARPRPSARQALTLPEAVRQIVTLAGGVETAHRAGVLHGGIEPAAVLVDDLDVPMLAGFTRRLGDLQPPALHEVTPHTAPEILLGENLGHAVDVYGLGSTLYELIAGHPAVRSYPGESAAALSLRVLSGTPAAVERAGVPFELMDVVNWTLAVDPAERPPSVAWLAEELGRIERRQGWPHTRLQVGAASEESTAPRRRARHRAG